MASSTLRPLSLGEILDAGIKVVTRHWKPLIGAQMLITAPVWVIFILLVASIEPAAFELVPDEPLFSTTSEPSAELVIGFLLTLVVLLFAFLVSFVALFKGVCDAWLGITPTIGRSLRFGARRSGWVFVLTLVWAPPVLVLMIPCGLPALWLGTVWCLSIPVLLFERVGPFKALGRSNGLVKGRFWACVLLVLVCFGVYEVVANALTLPLLIVTAVASHDNGIANAIAQGVGGLFASAISFPYIAAVLTILYFDQRVRKEGFDIQLMAEGLGVERDPDAPLPPPLQAPEGFVVPPPGPPQGWPPPGWIPPSAAHVPPLRWGPNAAPPPPPQDGEPREDRGRAGWLPPEPPRGPGGL